MLFNSLAFLCFFPIVTLLYFSAPQRSRWALLLGASCLFYMAFVPAYILILGFTIVVDYFAGLLIASATGQRRKLWLGLSLLANIGVLAIFKYYGFARDNLGELGMSLPALSIVLPIGLSFHTFQAMSYTIEVYRGAQRPERHFGIYALYVMFYPQLVAGPIERPQNMLHQFHESHAFDYERVTAGLRRMALGMVQKVVLADSLATEVNRIYAHPERFHGLPLIVATFYFAFQIYWDFAGYSNIALGSAQVMGFRLMRNFDMPYGARSVQEFWRRWHVSLSTWFRDYVYLPLGGSRAGRLRWAFAITSVFLLSGLWHGANWTFVIWGALHGGYVVLGRVLAPLRAAAARVLALPTESRWLNGVRVCWTFGLVALAWVFFRAPDVSTAFAILRGAADVSTSQVLALVQGQPLPGFSMWGLRLLAIGAMLWIDSYDRRVDLAQSLASWPALVRFPAYLALIYLPLFIGADGAEQQFIYFQF